MFTVVVDDREKFPRSYLDGLESKCIGSHQIRRIEIGDIAIYCNEALLVLIERKKVSDLAASMISGRLDEQMAALNSMASRARCILLVEGRADDINLRKKLNSILMRYPLIQISKIRNIEATIGYVCHLCEDFPLDIIAREPGGPDSSGRIVKAPLTPAEIAAKCLSEVKGVTPSLAKQILQTHSVRRLLAGNLDMKQLEMLKLPSGRDYGPT